jgi:hypothetical protein
MIWDTHGHSDRLAESALIFNKYPPRLKILTSQTKYLPLSFLKANSKGDQRVTLSVFL